MGLVSILEFCELELKDGMGFTAHAQQYSKALRAGTYRRAPKNHIIFIFFLRDLQQIATTIHGSWDNKKSSS